MNLHEYPVPHDQTAFTIAEGQAVIVLADSGKVVMLNEIGTQIWNLLDGQHDVEQITQAILAEYESEPEVVRKDTQDFLKKMEEIQAIVIKDTSSEK